MQGSEQLYSAHMEVTERVTECLHSIQIRVAEHLRGTQMQL